MTATEAGAGDWQKTVCILCSSNCGVEIRLDGRSFARVRGNKAHAASKGYTCEKALRLDHYQNATSRLTSPMRRRSDGGYDEISWETAIAEVAAGLAAVMRKHGGDKIFYYGGGGQGNHLVGAYGAATRKALGITHRSNALAQEKTGEAWVDGRMVGTHLHGDFHHAEVSVFVGKNPWHSHGFDEVRRVLKDISKDDHRSMVVIDPRRTETADLADYFLQVKPGTDAFCLAALGAVLVQDGLVNHKWLVENTVGADALMEVYQSVDVGEYSRRCGVTEELIRATAQRMASARSVAVLEDLGVEMAPHSTLVSFLQKNLWALVGSFGIEGGMTPHSSMVPLFNYGASGNEPAAPVTGGAVISGLVPCNEIAPGILSDHPDRMRAMFIESANPVHSLAGSSQFRDAMRDLDFSVVIDIAMTETAREASYVLPAASQYEKAEATFFNLGFPDNVFTVRKPLLAPLPGTLPEAEIHSRLLRELGILNESDLEPLRQAAKLGRAEFATAFMQAAAASPVLAEVGAVTLYETIGSTLPDGMADAALLWFSTQQCAMRNTKAVRAAGFEGEPHEMGNDLFDALISNLDGVVFTRHDYGDSFDLLRTHDQKIHLDIPEMLDDLRNLTSAPESYTSSDYPFVLAAGERRSFTANTIMRDPAWRKRDMEGALRVNPEDASDLGVANGSRIRITTPGGTAVAVVEVNDTYQRGHVSLPNGMGLDYSPAGGDPEVTGVAPNELTVTGWKDDYAGTPWHKHVPARLEAVKTS